VIKVRLAGELDRVMERVAQDFQEAFATDREQESKHAAGDAFGEFSLEQTAAHKRYMSEAESLLDDFLAEEKVSRSDFFAECRESVDGQYAALFDEDINLWFVDMLLGISDFEAFHRAAVQLLGKDGEERRARRK